MKNKLINKIEKSKIIQFIINHKECILILIISLLIMTPYLIQNTYINGDDTEFHISNVQARYEKFASGEFSFNKVLPIIANNFGYGTGIFYPGLAHTITAIIALVFGGNIILALKTIHFLTYFLSGITMYKLVKRVSNNRYSALISAIFYITFPYTITEVFRRDALAESLLFIFMPMVILGLYELFNGNKKQFYIWFIIGYVGMINSHLVLSVYFTILVMIYLIINIKKVFKKENLKPLIMAAILILLIISSFTIPLIEHKLKGEYIVFQDDSMSNPEGVAASTLLPLEYIFPSANTEFKNIHFNINILALVLAIYTIILIKKIEKSKEEKNLMIFITILAILSLFLMSGLCPWKYFPKILLMIQFVWRLSTTLVLTLSILAGLAFCNYKSRKSKTIWLIIIVIFNSILVYNTYNFELFEKDYNINKINMSERGMGWQKEYLPVETNNNQEYFDNRTEEIIIKQGQADIKIEENNTPYLKASITNLKEEIIIELPRIFYYGYALNLTDENGKTEQLELKKNGKGFIQTTINKNCTIELKYTGTMMAKIANYVSIITIIICIITLINTNSKNKRNIIIKKSE